MCFGLHDRPCKILQTLNIFSVFENIESPDWIPKTCKDAYGMAHQEEILSTSRLSRQSNLVPRNLFNFTRS
jgi:hypothetical protein